MYTFHLSLSVSHYYYFWFIFMNLLFSLYQPCFGGFELIMFLGNPMGSQERGLVGARSILFCSNQSWTCVFYQKKKKCSPYACGCGIIGFRYVLGISMSRRALYTRSFFEVFVKQTHQICKEEIKEKSTYSLCDIIYCIKDN